MQEIVMHNSHYISNITTIDPITGEHKPILELTIDNNILYVSFIRSSKEYSLDTLLNKIVCYARNQHIPIVQLRDDAQFLTLNGQACIHRSLFHRAFEGKPSIYESKGWKPIGDTAPLLAVITAFTNEDAQELIPVFNSIRPPCPSIPNNTTPFGKWINSQTCDILTYFYNILNILSTPTYIKRATTKGFIEALFEFKRINEVLLYYGLDR